VKLLRLLISLNYHSLKIEKTEIWGADLTTSLWGLFQLEVYFALKLLLRPVERNFVLKLTYEKDITMELFSIVLSQAVSDSADDRGRRNWIRWRKYLEKTPFEVRGSCHASLSLSGGATKSHGKRQTPQYRFGKSIFYCFKTNKIMSHSVFWRQTRTKWDQWKTYKSVRYPLF